LSHDQAVSNYCLSVRRAFEVSVLPDRFGVNAVSRADLIAKHTSPIADRLHKIGNRLTLICDCTYLRHEKSANNEYQRKSYSGQKKVPLCKPFTICTTNGYIVALPGPFEGTLNDAQILKIVLSDPDGISKLLQPGDIFILDRGFRDVKQFLEEKGFHVLMPALKGNRSQLPTEEANESRCVTKCRWPVEAVHGILGTKYKLLHHQFSNKMLPSAATYCRIACFLNNQFGKRLNSDVELIDDIVDRILLQKGKPNLVEERVKMEKLSRRKIPFRQLTSEELMDFPELTVRELKILFTGKTRIIHSPGIIPLQVFWYERPKKKYYLPFYS